MLNVLFGSFCGVALALGLFSIIRREPYHPPPTYHCGLYYCMFDHSTPEGAVFHREVEMPSRNRGACLILITDDQPNGGEL